MTAKTSFTWLITGASSGIGKSLALEALKSGARVVGTTRDIDKAEISFPEFVKRGGIWIALDPAQKDAFERFSKCATEYDIDVLINNAGYAFIGGVEDTSEDEVREQMEVNFYGPLRAVRACLPVMRSKGLGNLVLISSGAGFIARPARSSYSASKFAIEAVYESLSHELNTFGIKVLIVEPGAFRTPFASRIKTPAQYQVSNGFSEAYKGTAVEQMVNGTVNIMSIPDFVKGDPDKAARAVTNAIIGGHDYLRMPLGPDCVTALEDKIRQLQKDLDATRFIATGTNFG
ncbi:putative short chain oxidoreductase protein [Botrytis fragariae]|uniref:Putative short chain oxidoreductase protein n=1 Tax=Botrytis fragariae TaxID=1964551 RepID=A0A8H6EDL0_9HELO|nr:putative short chain oxidoreductase protein [Botrytis fragariae]KAF5868379.1 putative short chain oxidoreductase protein [Botrytis fragariae]